MTPLPCALIWRAFTFLLAGQDGERLFGEEPQ
jgi:hypothetical protein